MTYLHPGTTDPFIWERAGLNTNKIQQGGMPHIISLFIGDIPIHFQGGCRTVFSIINHIVTAFIKNGSELLNIDLVHRRCSVVPKSHFLFRVAVPVVYN